MKNNNTISANGVEIRLYGNVVNEEAYISLTDIAKYKNSDDPRIVISNWMSSYATIDYLAMWEGLYNPDFNRMEFQTVRNEPGRLVMTPTQWIEKIDRPKRCTVAVDDDRLIFHDALYDLPAALGSVDSERH